MMKRLTLLLALCLVIGMFAACGGEAAPAEAAPSAVSEAPVSETPASEAPAPVTEAPKESSAVEASEAEDAAAEVSSAVEEASVVEEPAGPCTVTFSDGQTFEATVGEDFVFFFQCNAPGDMGEPAEGEEGAGITVSDGTVTYSHVSLGGPYQYPTSELVTISGFTGDFTVTITEAATFMDATYAVYTDQKDIDDAIAFADYMAAQQAANPMP